MAKASARLSRAATTRKTNLIRTIPELITALGGERAVCSWLYLEPGDLEGWKERGYISRPHTLQVYLSLQVLGYIAEPKIFGVQSMDALMHPAARKSQGAQALAAVPLLDDVRELRRLQAHYEAAMERTKGGAPKTAWRRKDAAKAAYCEAMYRVLARVTKRRPEHLADACSVQQFIVLSAILSGGVWGEGRAASRAHLLARAGLHNAVEGICARAA